jgi:hypothetical protein
MSTSQTEVLPRDVTGAEIERAVTEAKILRIEHHDCGMCGYMTSYLVNRGELFFDAGCDCVRYAPPPRLVSWDDAADWINMQSSAEWKTKIAKSFGIDLAASQPAA